MDEKYNDLIGDMIKENNYDYEKNLSGKGKPLSKDYMKMDTFQHFQKIAKDSGFLPPWLKLQKEIADLLQKAKSDKDINEINKKVKKHNKICPTPMQKELISLENLEKTKRIW